MRIKPIHVPLLCAVLVAGCASDSAPPGAAARPRQSLTRDIPTFEIEQLSRRPVGLWQPPPGYPLVLRRAGVEGYVVADFIVNADGTVHHVFAVRSSNSLFAEAAVAAVKQWRYRPGYIGERAVNTHLQVPIKFALSDAERAAFRTHKRLPPEAVVYTASDGVQPPTLLRQAPPLYPPDCQSGGIEGSAVVEFVVTTDGSVADARVSEATRPEFGEAAVAAVEHWVFKPAQREGVPVNFRQHAPIVFTLRPR